jgi:hypothetical protein
MQIKFTRFGSSWLFIALAVLTGLSLSASWFRAATKEPAPSPEQALTAAIQFQIDRSQLESPKGMKFYNIKRLPVREEMIARFEKELGLTPKATSKQNLEVLEERSGIARFQSDKERGHMTLIPSWGEVAHRKPELVSKENAFRVAKEFTDRNELIVKDVSVTTPQQLVTLSRAELHEGQKAAVTDVGQTVLFQRTIGEKPVLGNGSQLFVDLGDKGSVVGFTRMWNPLAMADTEPVFKGEREIYGEVESQLKQRIHGRVKAKVGKLHLVYYSSDKEYVQPAYFFTIHVDTPGVKGKSFLTGVIAAAKNSPEPIRMRATPSEFPTEKKAGASLRMPASSLAADDPTVGRYVVRQDSSDWVDDANEFKQGLNDGHPFSFPAITFGDYFWDEPALWTSAEDSFVDRWNIALMEGHGNTWLFTTRSNCCDVVDLNAASQPGYGDRPSSSMRFLVLKGCSIIPAPPDRSDWPDPWWRVFKGLRQAVGFRTEMYIDDDISYGFAKDVSQNYRVLDSWFAATNGSSSYQWERFWGSWGDEIYGYGTVVMIPGEEVDGIYRTGAVPPASSAGLSIWWQH